MFAHSCWGKFMGTFIRIQFACSRIMSSLANHVVIFIFSRSEKEIEKEKCRKEMDERRSYRCFDTHGTQDPKIGIPW